MASVREYVKSKSDKKRATRKKRGGIPAALKELMILKLDANVSPSYLQLRFNELNLSCLEL